MYGQPLNWFQRLLQRFQPTPTDIAQAELREAEIAKLHAHSEAEYAALRTQMHRLTAEYHADRINRLRTFLGIAPVDGTFMAGENDRATSPMLVRRLDETTGEFKTHKVG